MHENKRATVSQIKKISFSFKNHFFESLARVANPLKIRLKSLEHSRQKLIFHGKLKNA